MVKFFIITSLTEINYNQLKKYDKILAANPNLWHACNEKGLNTSLLSDELTRSEILSCYNFANRILKKISFKEKELDFIEFFRIYYWEFFYEYKLLNIFFNKKKSIIFYLNENLKKNPSSHLEILKPEYLLNFYIKNNLRNFYIIKKFDILNIFKIKLITIIKFFYNLNKKKNLFFNFPSKKIYDNLFVASDNDLDKLIKLCKDKDLKKNNLIFGIHKSKDKIIKFFKEKNSKVEFFDINLFIKFNLNIILQKKFEASDYLNKILDKYKIKISKDYFKNLNNDYSRAKLTNNILKDFFIQNDVREIHLVDFNGFIERSIEQLSKILKMKINLYPHGWLGNPEAYFFNLGKYFYNGILEKKILVENNKNLEFSKIKKNIIKKSIPKKVNKVLILTTRARNRFASNLNTKKFLSDWNIFLKTLVKYNTFEIHFKFHPNHNYKDWLINFMSKNNLRNYTIVDGDIAKISNNYDLVIDFGMPGSATREILFSGTLILIYTGLYSFDRGTNSYLYNSEFTIDNINHLCENFTDCIKNPLIELKKIKLNNKKLSKLL